jgi:hypothetical protein
MSDVDFRVLPGFVVRWSNGAIGRLRINWILRGRERPRAVAHQSGGHLHGQRLFTVKRPVSPHAWAWARLLGADVRRANVWTLLSTRLPGNRRGPSPSIVGACVGKHRNALGRRLPPRKDTLASWWVYPLGVLLISSLAILVPACQFSPSLCSSESHVCGGSRTARWGTSGFLLHKAKKKPTPCYNSLYSAPQEAPSISCKPRSILFDR